MTNTFFSRQYGFLYILDLRLFRIELVNFFVEDLVHYVELELLNGLDESASVVFRDAQVLLLIPHACQLFIQFLGILHLHLQILVHLLPAQGNLL